ncbi:MAG: flagellar biosynthetic protein FliO [Burkholderiales bacterium]
MIRNPLHGAALTFALWTAELPAQAAERAAAVAPPVVGPAAGMLQVFAGLLLVLLAVIGLAWAFKRFGPRQHGAVGVIRVVGGALVGQRERVVLVEVGDTWLVLGVAPGRVNALHSMPRKERLPDSPATPQAAAGFQAWLKQMMDKRDHG